MLRGSREASKRPSSTRWSRVGVGAVSFTVDPTGPGDPEGRGCEGSARGDFSALWLSCLSSAVVV